MNWAAINMSNKSLPVYDVYNRSKRLGTIYKRELFGVDRKWGGDDYFYRIVFRNPSGKKSVGLLINPPRSALENAYKSKYSYGVRLINGTYYYAFKMTRTEPIYHADGRRVGAVAAGRYVYTKSNPSTGDNHPDWLQIYYAEKTNGKLDRIHGAGYNYGFVNIGLEDGSMWNTISCDGLWSPHF